MKKNFYRLMALLAAAVIFWGAVPHTVQAEPEPSQPEEQTVFLSSYSLTNEKIVPGSDFELKLLFLNTSAETADGVVVDVLNPNGVYPVYGTVSQAVVDIPANGEKEITFRYNALEYMDAPVLDFQIVVQDRGMLHRTYLRAPVGTESPFNVIATSVPARAPAGENVNCSMTFKYIGKENVENIRARMDVNGKTVQTGEIGKLSRDTTKTQSMFASFESPGNYVVELFLDYQDERGKEQSVLAGTSVLEIMGSGSQTVVPGIQQQIEEQLNNQVEEKMDSAKVLIISGSLILIIFAIIVFLIKKK